MKVSKHQGDRRPRWAMYTYSPIKLAGFDWRRSHTRTRPSYMQTYSSATAIHTQGQTVIMQPIISP